MPRFEMLKQYKNDTTSAEFLATPEGKKFMELTNKGRDAFISISKNADALAQDIEQEEHELLDGAKKIWILMALLVSGLTAFLFWVITTKIKNSLSNAAKECDYIGKNKDLSHPIAITGNDEIANIMRTVNTLFEQLRIAIDNAKRTAMENAAVAEELSSTSLQIGKRTEETDQEVDHAVNTTKKVASILHDSEKNAEHAGTVMQNVANELNNASNEVLVQKSLVESNATVAVITQSVNTTSDLMKKNAKEIQSLGQRAENTQQLMLKTVSSMNETATVAEGAAKEVKHGSVEANVMLERVNTIHKLTSTNARSVEEIASAAEHLAKLSTSLSNALSAFKTA
ncbi:MULTISPECIES: HAMP domain-containing protein [unclassified Sulfurospirillum]|uniref:HAMP domain-containing protein n=1 Tax=unclassified Sulfurospirillum TaxID=2618290 RepID=UPI00068FB1E7|nr:MULTISPECIES: HAMP domain-containing protein [unclassified Sulfurospirillum]